MIHARKAKGEDLVSFRVMIVVYFNDSYVFSQNSLSASSFPRSCIAPQMTDLVMKRCSWRSGPQFAVLRIIHEPSQILLGSDFRAKHH